MTRKATYKIPGTHSQIVLEVCNIFDQTGPKVVHCHNTFDTSSEVMRETSVMGQFIKLCASMDFDLDSAIDNWISKNQQKSAKAEYLPCRKRIFELGTICPINVSDDLYLLTSFEDLKYFLESGAMDFDSYLMFLDNLWMSVVRMGIDKTIINIPTFGNKIVNISNNGFTVDQKVGLIVQSYFKAMRQHKLFESLRICIHESDQDRINLEHWETVLLPYLHQFAQLPLGLKASISKQKGLYVGIKKTINTYDPNIELAKENKPKQIFISHAKEDCDQADIIYQYLQGLGYKCWMDTHDITPGIPYAKEIMSGFCNSSAVVVIISKNTMHSVGVKNEIDNVYKKNKIIIPFRIDDTELSDELSFYLSSTQWINAFPSFEDHLDELEKALSQLIK